MDKLGAMNAFAKVVALGNFAEAARALGSTRSAASKTVMELEHVLGVRLLDRTTRRVRTTEAGLAYYERCLDILARVEETEMQVSRLQGEPKGVLKLNGPTSFGALYLGPAVADFMAAYPELKIELTLTDRFIDPIEEGVDVTIRIAELPNSSLIARKLAPARRVFVSSPAYVARHGAPEAPEDLARHPCLTYGHTTTLQRWRIVRDGEAVMRPDPFRPLLEQRRHSAGGGARRTGRRDPADIPCRSGHRDRLARDRARPLSAARTGSARAVCLEPLSGCQDPRFRRLPCQALWRRADMGPLPTSETAVNPRSVNRPRAHL